MFERRLTGHWLELEKTSLHYSALLLITVLAALLRFYKLGEWSFWIDEIFNLSRVQIHYGTLAASVNNIPPARPWLPLSLLLTSGTISILGVSEWSARVAPALIGIISLPILYFPIKRYLGVTVALLAVLFLAVSPWHLYWSQNARFYTALLLFCTLALWTLFQGLEQDRPALLGLFIIFTYLAVSERLLALFLAPIVALYLLLLVVAGRPKPVGLRRRNLLLILAPGFAFLLLELYKFLTTGVPTLVYEGQFFAGQANHSPARLLLSIGFRLGIPLICLGLVGGFYLLIEQTRLGLFLCLAAGTPILLLLIIAPFAFTVDRYVFFILPFWAILTAVALTRLFAQANQYGKLLPLGVLALVLAVLMGENLLYFQYQNGNRPDWRAAFAVVEQQRQPGDIVLATRPEVGHFYLSPAVGALPKAAGNDITQLGERIWFVLDEATSPVNPALLAWLQQNSRLVEIVPVYMAGKSLTIRIYLFDSTP